VFDSVVVVAVAAVVATASFVVVDTSSFVASVVATWLVVAAE